MRVRFPATPKTVKHPPRGKQTGLSQLGIVEIDFQRLR